MQKRVQRREVDVVINDKGSPHKGKVVKETATYDTPPKQRTNQQLQQNVSNNTNSGGKAPAGFNLPNPDELAQRYGVEAAFSPGSPNYGPDNAEFERQAAMNEELANIVQTLKRKVDEKNRKIENLCVLLESLEPVPGLDPGKIQGLATGALGEEQVDLRDSKIVALAKKSHNLQMVVNKERAKSEKLTQDLEEARKRIQSLNQDLEQQKSAILAAAKPDRNYNRHALVDQAKKDEEEEQKAQTLKQLKEALKLADETKEKLKKTTEENKKLAKALERELGDGVTLEQAVDGGWRGRAQQIVMLKAKVKQLESNQATRATLHQRGNDVDVKAEEELSEMSKERRQVVEQLTEERVRLVEINQSLEKKVSAQKARIHILETEVRKTKENVQVAFDKSNSDDQLIEALRAEIHKLQGKLKAAEDSNSSTRQLSGSMSAPGKAGYNPMDRMLVQEWQTKEEHYKSEMARLQRLCRNQSDQLESQDVTIRELRKKLGQQH